MPGANLSLVSFELPIMTVTGRVEFDLFFSLVFVLGVVFFVAAAPIRVILNRYL